MTTTKKVSPINSAILIASLPDVTLYSTKDGADKQYRVWIEQGKPARNGSARFYVRTEHGKRGGNQTPGCSAPITREEAQSQYDGIVKEKMSPRKGYAPGTASAAKLETADKNWVKSREGKATTFIGPMLLVPLSASDAPKVEQIVSDDLWIAQMKFDGIRAQIHKNGAKVTCYSRTGRITAIPAALEATIKAMPPVLLILDGELVDGIFCAFDCLYHGGDLRNVRYSERLATLADLIPAGIDAAAHKIMLAITARSSFEKAQMIAKLRESGAEGVVFKLATAAYTTGRSHETAFKFKFVATASVIVSKVNAKRSVDMRLADGTEIGSVTIPPNKTIPAAGSVIEVRYLYAHRGGSLSQAVYLMTREDVGAADCTASQLQYKAEPRADATPAPPAPTATAPRPAPATPATTTSSPKEPTTATGPTPIDSPRRLAALKAWETMRRNKASREAATALASAERKAS